MTWAMEASVKAANFPDTPGISQRAIRQILAVMARIAKSDGTFRWGLGGSKVAALSDYSDSAVRRAQRVGIKIGFLEQVEVGGGRKATKWRIVVEALANLLPKTQQHERPDTPAMPERHSPTARTGKFRGLFKGDGLSRPRHQSLGPILTGDDTAVVDVCVHGGAAGLQPTTGLPRCPQCRKSA